MKIHGNLKYMEQMKRQGKDIIPEILEQFEFKLEHDKSLISYCDEDPKVLKIVIDLMKKFAKNSLMFTQQHKIMIYILHKFQIFIIICQGTFQCSHNELMLFNELYDSLINK